MLDDPRMTNSTFNEGYDVSGALHYPAYEDDARISHAHGWSTGPIIALTNFAAGLHMLNHTSWVVHPQPGNLTSVKAGFEIEVGAFSAEYTVVGGGMLYQFSTPEGTRGELVLDLPGCDAEILVQGGSGSNFRWGKKVAAYHGSSPAGCGYWGPRAGTEEVANGTVTIDGLEGGDYQVSIQCV